MQTTNENSIGTLPDGQHVVNVLDYKQRAEPLTFDVEVETDNGDKFYGIANGKNVRVLCYDENKRPFMGDSVEFDWTTFEQTEGIAQNEITRARGEYSRAIANFYA